MIGLLQADQCQIASILYTCGLVDPVPYDRYSKTILSFPGVSRKSMYADRYCTANRGDTIGLLFTSESGYCILGLGMVLCGARRTQLRLKISKALKLIRVDRVACQLHD